MGWKWEVFLWSTESVHTKSNQTESESRPFVIQNTKYNYKQYYKKKVKQGRCILEPLDISGLAGFANSVGFTRIAKFSTDFWTFLNIIFTAQQGNKESDNSN